ncbi:MAG TPA: PAS domain S-box protein [Candidatus Acidoferrales bacterium]|nr:PAS domain S-box protein [Candidatus Acidoferrales bacterium]
MTQELFERHIKATRQRLETLQQRASSASGEPPLLQEILAALATTLAELEASAAELRERERDVSERQHSEAALRESQARTAAILNTVIDGIVTIDARGIIRSFNPAAERLFGYSAQEIIGQSVTLLMPSPYAEQHQQFVADYLRTGVRKIIGIGREVIGRGKDGTTFPIELAVSELKLEDGPLFIGVVHDLTARKRTEEMIRSNEARFHAFMDNSPVVAFLKDESGRYVYVNATYERFFATSAAEIRGQTDFDLRPAIADRLQANDRTVRESGKLMEFAEVVWTADGTRREWMVFKFPVTDASGRYVGGIALDVTDRKRAERQLRALQERAQQRERLADIGAITAQIVHDVGNPLAGVSMQGQLILRRAQRDPNQPLSTILKPAERIVAEVHRLDGLIKEFMEFGREQHLELKTVDVQRFLEQVVDLWEPVAAMRGIGLDIVVRESLPSLIADEEKLRRVLDNLVKNAIEAMERGPGRIEIQATMPTRDTVCIAVADTGPGIPETVEVFRLFETTKTHGTGVGLAVVRQIVLAHRGSIRHARRDPRGTVFLIELPCAGPIT